MKKLSLKELGRASLEEFKNQPKTPIVLVLDNVRSGLNVGSAFRTADAFALEKIILCGITAKPPHREIFKTAIGATESMDWVYFGNTLEAIEALKKEGYKIIAVEQAEGSFELQDVGNPQRGGRSFEKCALVFGNEVKGVDESVMKSADACVEVPQFGTKHSLNIAVCVGVVVWEFFKRWKFGE